MELKKAIAILSILMEVKARIGSIDHHDAIELGLQALLEKEEREKRETK